MVDAAYFALPHAAVFWRKFGQHRGSNFVIHAAVMFVRDPTNRKAASRRPFETLLRLLFRRPRAPSASCASRF
jgi:hypothetical protein